MIWFNEQLDDFNRPTGRAPAYLPPEHRQRWQRLRMARTIYEGRHRCYFWDEQRTQFDYPEVRIGERVIRPYVTFNLLRLVSVKTADLLFGAKAKLDAPSRQQTDRLDELSRRSKLHGRFHAATVDASWAGGGFLESMLFEAEGYLDRVEPDEIYPLGLRRPDDQYDRYIRYATANVGSAERPLNLLLETTYEPGRIVRSLWQLEPNGLRGSRVALDQWPHFGGEVPPEEQRTGLRENTITFIPNESGGRLELSDYDGLIELQDSVNAKMAQIARVLAKHADPKLAVPESGADPQGNVRASHDLFFFRSKDEIPQYITWTAELTAAMADREAAVDALCVAAEMSQILLGIKKGATPDAARKLRLEATNSLAKVGRKAINIEPAIARAIEATQKLDQTSSRSRQYPVDAVGVEMRDGLPTDPLDDANEISMLRSAQVMSVEDAVERRKEDPDAVAIELQRLAKEREAATPPMLFGEPPAGNSNMDGQDKQDQNTGGPAVGTMPMPPRVQTTG